MDIYLCKYCGKPIPAYKCRERKYCSLEHYHLDTVRTHRKIVNCVVCKKEFEAELHSKKKCCSFKCKGVWHSQNTRGSNNYNWKGGSIYGECAVCNKKMKVLRNLIGKKKCCSVRCSVRLLWKEGKIKHYNFNNRMNKSEAKFDALLKEWLPNEYKYVGNRQVIINGKNPDFININGQKKIIELVGEHWHEKEYEFKRPRIFKGHGYDTLIVWEKELGDTNKLNSKILEFNTKC